MSMDLIISGSGKVMVASNLPFADEVTRVDFDAQTRLISIAYRASPEQVLQTPVHDRMLSALMKAPSVVLVEMKNNRPIGGYDVPLVSHS